MEILKWYSIIILGFGTLVSLLNMLSKDRIEERIAHAISLVLYVPIIIYLLCK